MTTKPDPRQVVENMGGVREVHIGLREFSDRVKVFDGRRAELTAKYPNQWVAMYNEDIVVADSLEDVLARMDDREIPRKGAVVEFMDTERRNMVL